MSPSRAAKAAPLDWLTILQFGLGALGILFAGLLAFAQLLAAFGSFPENGQLELANLTAGAGMLLVALLLVPSTALALRRILGRPVPIFQWRGRFFGLAIFAFPALLPAGAWALDQGLGWLVLLIHLSASALLVAWLLWIALRNLKPGSAQRAWGAFSSGLAATPLLALILELTAGLFVGLLVLVYVGLNPELSRLVEQLSSSPDTESVLQLAAPLMNDPMIILAVLAILGVIVPVIEEVLKPLGVYLLLGRKLSEAQGFALGALSGAGYALFENLALNTAPETLFLGAVGRFGASAMHIFTAALSGWALARAAKQKQPWLFLRILALNIFIHGLWNSLVVLFTAGAFSEFSSSGLVPPVFAILAPIALLLIALACIVLLGRFNRRLLRARAAKANSL
ncbi:MAG: PrsW family glutamic-type intramembrane protease [Anaerolineales bacterium]